MNTKCEWNSMEECKYHKQFPSDIIFPRLSKLESSSAITYCAEEQKTIRYSFFFPICVIDALNSWTCKYSVCGFLVKPHAKYHCLAVVHILLGTAAMYCPRIMEILCSDCYCCCYKSKVLWEPLVPWIFDLKETLFV